MLFTGVQQHTMIDYPRKNACVVFAPGCNFRCPFCHNSESVLPDRIQEDKALFIRDTIFFNFLDTRKGLLDGVSICGGEPTLQPDLYDFAKKIKEKGFLVKLDTNGRDVDIVEKMIKDEILDYVAVDLKHIPEKYDEACGVTVKKDFWDNYERLLSLLQAGNTAYEYRTTLIKGMHTEEDVVAMAIYLAGIPSRYLQTYKPGNTLDPDFSGQAFTYEEMKKFQTIGAEQVQQCVVRE